MPGNAANHTHRGDRFGVAPACIQKGITCHGKLRGAAGRVPRSHLGHSVRATRMTAPASAVNPIYGMEQKADGEINRHPW